MTSSSDGRGRVTPRATAADAAVASGGASGVKRGGWRRGRARDAAWPAQAAAIAMTLATSAKPRPAWRRHRYRRKAAAVARARDGRHRLLLGSAGERRVRQRRNSRRRRWRRAVVAIASERLRHDRGRWCHGREARRRRGEETALLANCSGAAAAGGAATPRRRGSEERSSSPQRRGSIGRSMPPAFPLSGPGCCGGGGCRG